MKSLSKETFNAAYSLSPIIILFAISAMVLMKKERKQTQIPRECKEINTNRRAGNKMYEANSIVFDPAFPTSAFLPL
jgi:hypothetical protein